MTQEPEKQPDSSQEKNILGIDVSDIPKFLSWSSLGGKLIGIYLSSYIP